MNLTTRVTEQRIDRQSDGVRVVFYARSASKNLLVKTLWGSPDNQNAGGTDMEQNYAIKIIVCVHKTIELFSF